MRLSPERVTQLGHVESGDVSKIGSPEIGRHDRRECIEKENRISKAYNNR